MSNKLFVTVFLSVLSGFATAQFASDTDAPSKSATSGKSSSTKSSSSNSHARQSLAKPSDVSKQFASVIWGDNLDSASFLLQQGADINCRNCFDAFSNAANKTILMAVAGHPYQAVSKVSWLVEKGANINIKDNFGNTALQYAIADDPYKNRNEWPVDFVSGLDWPNFRQKISYLLDRGLSADLANDDGDAPLHLIARLWRSIPARGAQSDYKSIQEYGSIVNELVSRGANVNKQNKKGFTPIMNAARHCNIETVRFFASIGASLKVKDVAGKTLVELTRDRAISNPTPACIEVANALKNGSIQSSSTDIQSIASVEVGRNAGGSGLGNSSGKVPISLVGQFSGYVTSTLSPNQKIAARGTIQANGDFLYEGNNGVVISGRFDAGGANIQGRGKSRLPKVAGKQYTYPNGEPESDITLTASFDGQILNGDFSSKYETGTFRLCTQSNVDPSCNAGANPIEGLLKGIGGLLRQK